MKFPDVWNWLSTLHSPTKWQQHSASLQLCASPGTLVSMSLCLQTSLQSVGSVYFSLIASVNSTDSPIYLWKSDSYPFFAPSSSSSEETVSLQQKTFPLLLNALDYIIRQGPESDYFTSLPSIESSRDQLRLHLAIVQESPHYGTIFNCCFMCLCLCACVLEAPTYIRSPCLELLEPQTNEACNQTSLRVVLQALGPCDMDLPFMRSMGLMITHRMMEKQILPMKDDNDNNMWEKSIRTPFTYSYPSVATEGFWKVALYAPLLSMQAHKMSLANPNDVEREGESPLKNRALLCALRYQQAEATIQLRYTVNVKNSGIDVSVGIDNVRCVVCKLASASIMKMHKAPLTERHFPSKMVLYLSPEEGCDIPVVSASLSSDNPVYNIVSEQSMQTQMIGARAVAVSHGVKESRGVKMRPWKHEQWVEGRRGKLQWTLYDPTNTKEVASYKPTKVAMLMTRAWFRDRGFTGTVPFTKEGGVVFACDNHPHGITWRLNRNNMEGKKMRWKIWGEICVTYWPNRYPTFYCETRSLEFSEILELSLVQTST